MSERKKTILIVDDEAHIVHIIRYKLEREGYEVVTAGDGQEAYELAQSLDPDLIVTDFQMPVLSGYEMCVKLHESEVTAAVLATLRDDDSVQMRLLALDHLAAHSVDRDRIREVIEERERPGHEALKVRLAEYEKQT